MNLKNIRNMVVFLTLVAFTTSCATAKPVGGLYSEMVPQGFSVDNPRIRHNEIQLNVYGYKDFETKQRMPITLHQDWMKENRSAWSSVLCSFPIQTVFLSVIGFPLIPLILAGMESIGDRDEIPFILSLPFGGYFWAPSPWDTMPVVISKTSIGPYPLAQKNVQVKVNNTGNIYNVRTDHNGVARLKLTDEQLPLSHEAIRLVISNETFSENARLDILGFDQERYGVDDVLKLRELAHYKISLSVSEREYILSNIDSFNINSDWDALSVFASARMHSYLNPDPPSVPEIPEKIPEPELPPVQEIAKSPFESRSAFKARMEEMKHQRNNQIQDLLQAHKDKVDARNAEIRRLKADYEAQLKKHEKEVRFRQQNRDKKSQQYMVELFPEIFGEAKLVAAHTKDGAPKYDPENNIMYATLYYGLKNNPKLEKPIAFPNVPEGSVAEAFYKNLRSGEIRPHVDFSFENNFFAFHSVTPENESFKKYVGKESFSEFKKGEEIKVVLGHDEKDARTRLSQAEKVDFEMQSASVKDVKFEVWMANEMREYNDDIPAMLEKAASVPVDKSRWLFVIGIEEYRNTNRINFSRRSSELFTEVAMKRLGIDSSRVFLLVDDGKTVLDAVPANRVHPATAGSIKDQMRYLVRDIEPGDTIYFYYSGHGVPAVDDERRPYIMAQDQAPDFVSYEKELRIQEIYTTLSNSGAGRVMAFMDSCFTGETDGRSVFMGDIGSTRLVPRETTFDKETMAVITAGTKNQFSNVYREKGHRLFSYYLMQALLRDYESVGPLFREIQTNTRSTSRDFGGANLQTPTLEGNAMLRLR